MDVPTSLNEDDARRLSAEDSEEWAWVPTSAGLAIALSLLWYVVAMGVFALATSGRNLEDPSLGTHMGSVATTFWASLTVGIIYVLPFVVVPSYAAWRRGRPLGPPLVVAIVVAGCTLTFYATGYVNCVPAGGDVPVAGDVGLVVVPLVAAAVGGAWLGRFGSRRGHPGTASAVAGATWVMWHIQFEHCSVMSSQVIRGFENYLLIPVLGLPVLYFMTVVSWEVSRRLSRPRAR